MEEKQEEKVKGNVTIGDKAKKKMENNKGVGSKTNKNIIIAGVAVLVVIVVILVIMLGARATNKAKLDQELAGIFRGEIKINDTQPKTSGKFGEVEQAVKEYFKEYTELQEQITTIIEDEKIQKMLTTENYEQDGPEFTESKKYIEEAKQELASKIERLKGLTSEEGIMARIEEKKVGSYYVNLYKDYFFAGQDLSKEFKEVYDELDLSKQIMDTLYDNEIKILNFLTENKDHWKIQNSRVAFDNASILAQYNSLRAQFNAQ